MGSYCDVSAEIFVEHMIRRCPGLTGNPIDRYRDYISVPAFSVYRLVMLRDDDTRGALTLKLDHEEGKGSDVKGFVFSKYLVWINRIIMG